MGRGAPLAFAAVAAATLASTLSAQASDPTAPPAQKFGWPDSLRNPQVLPRDIGAQHLRETMIGFANALGVRCSHCHVDGEDVPLVDRDFASDANSRKDVARAMMRMVRHLNEERLPAISGLSDPRVTCYTCHRGAAEPAVAPPPDSGQ